MKVTVVGGGPAGLYFSYLLQRDHPEFQIRVFERNSRDATFGFGVVFSDNALEFLRHDDEDTYRYLKPHLESWPDLKIVHKDQVMLIDGIGLAAIGRLELLQLLQRRCEQVGVQLSFNSALFQSPLDQHKADLVVAADGVSSALRRVYASTLGSTESRLKNPFIWYGTTKLFDCLSLTFRENADGVFCAHHYPYNKKMSTFIIETDAATFNNAGFENLSAQATRDYCERVFASDLEGRPLISNFSTWRRFPQIWNECWSAGNLVLLGDAAHTAHFSIGSGTRLAMEDANALFKSIKAFPNNLATALKDYQKIRQPVVRKLVNAAKRSARWYEQMSVLVRSLEPRDFACSYMTRTGRVDEERLKKIAPKFMSSYRSPGA